MQKQQTVTITTGVKQKRFQFKMTGQFLPGDTPSILKRRSRL